MNLADIYAACDPHGWDACRISDQEFRGGSLYTTEPTGLDFEIALAALLGEEVSISEAASAVDLLGHALDHLDRQYGLGDYGGNEELPPKHGPYNYIRGATARQRRAREKRKKVAA